MKDSFFMGGMTPDGFSTRLTELVNDNTYYTYILKGGPGTGKSSLIKKVADSLSETESISYYFCPADPESLDAVELHDSKTVIVDGTPPHTFEPGIPGVCQRIIDLGQYWDSSCLVKNRTEIITVSENYRSVMAGASESSRALGMVCDHIHECATGGLNRQMVDEAARCLCSELFEKRREREGEKSVRQLSAMTRYGYMTMLDTIGSYSNIIVLDDPFFAASDSFIDTVAGQAVEHGYDVKLSTCLLCDRTVREHLLIDEISVALVTADPLTQISIPKATNKDLSDYYEKAWMQANEDSLKAYRTSLNNKVVESSDDLANAKRMHDKLERYYIDAMDFTVLDSICRMICEETEQRRNQQ